MSYIGSKPADKALTSADIEDGTITTADLQNNAVNATKLDLTDDYSFTGTITGAGGINTPLFQAKLSSNTVISDATTTLIPADTEELDTDNCYNNTGSTVTLNGISTPAYAFAPNVAGKYYIEAQSTGFGGTVSGLTIISTFIYKNGSVVKSNGINLTTNAGYVMSTSVAVIVEMNGTSDYVQAYSRIDGNTQARLQANDFCTFGGYKIIE